ncbi:unnamed protein product [Scytosiphon promiscuus]
MATLAKPLGAGDTKKVRRMRKKLEGKATGGSITTVALLQQCRDAGVLVKPLLTPRLERHGRQPTLSAKEARQLVLHCASGSTAPKVAEIRNLPAVRAVLVLALTGTAAAASTAAAARPETDGEQDRPKLTVPPAASANPLDGFTEDFKAKFRLCAGLRISSGGSTAAPVDSSATASDGIAAGADAGGGGGWLKSLADAFLYAPLGEDREACPAGPFSGRKKRKATGGRKKKTKGDAKRRRKAAEGGEQQRAERGGREGVVPDPDDVDDAEGDSSGEEDGDHEDMHQDGEVENASVSAARSSGGGGTGVGDSTAKVAATGTAARVQGGENAEACEESRGAATSDDEGQESDEATPLPAIETYLLTIEQLKENGFPVSCPEKENVVGTTLPSLSEKMAGKVVLPTAAEAQRIVDAAPKLIDLEGYVQTQPLSSGAVTAEEGDAAGGGARVFGLDCEMCMTEAGLELTRVTLVDDQHKVLLDELVKPDKHIVDYVTRYSGITPQLLEKVDTRLHQVQAAILRLVGAEDVLVGHSLENDLKALKMMHLRCLDTALLYPHPKKGRRSSLRYLVSMYLQRTIQTSTKGHNSAEDAIAALELAQLKISRGPNFGAERSTDSVFDRLHRNRVPSTMVASSEQCRRHVSGAASAVPSFSDDGVVQTVLKELKGVEDGQRTGTKPPLVWAELEGPKCPTIQQVCAAANKGSAGVRAFLDGMDKAGRSAGHERRVSRLLDELPPGVMVFVASQGVNPELPRKLDNQRKACEDRRCASMWSAGQGLLLTALEGRARDGCVFVAVT